MKMKYTSFKDMKSSTAFTEIQFDIGIRPREKDITHKNTAHISP